MSLYVAICVYIKQHMSYPNALNSITTWIILMYSSPCLSVAFYNSKKFGSHHQPPINFQLQYTCIVTLQLVTHTPMGNNFAN